MKSRFPVFAFTTMALLRTSQTLHATEESPKPVPSTPATSIQQQIDELKLGQSRVLKELEEIKKLLQEGGGSGGRIEVSAKPTPPPVIPMIVRGEPFRGATNASIAIMEYSDFDCSFCGNYVRQIFPRIEEDYIKPGRVKYFFRDMPAAEHPNAMAKARAARCAWEQGKFWEMHDRLFATQTAPDGADMVAHARALELDMEKFNGCFSSGKYAENINRAAAGARRVGVYGTPAFLIGTITIDGVMNATKVLVGGESYDEIKHALDELLGSKSGGE